MPQRETAAKHRGRGKRPLLSPHAHCCNVLKLSCAVESSPAWIAPS
ncbi:hypothetical protein PpBr36_05205 [Pyricularia pennisetigena]|nr:hypothetical protein PpBr36_05205 [Pyricularia pennisetigena]TLS26847.1 hypothetical protein PpBr36_05205 [Pyricularia pennisetigena]